MMLRLWDTVSDRLFKIRNSLDIRGVKRRVSLFAPPIDPAALVRAVGSGVPLEDAIAGLTNPPGRQYRFRVLAARAKEAVGAARSLGGQLQSALERKDGEQLALMQQHQQREVLGLQSRVRDLQVAEAERQLEAVAARRESAEARRSYYASRKPLSLLEGLALADNARAADLEERAAKMSLVSDAIGKLPDFKTGVSGALGSPVATMQVGGSMLRDVLALRAAGLRVRAQIKRASAAELTTSAGYERRFEDWQFQREQAELELKQIAVDEASAKLRLEIAEKEKSNLERQIEHQNEVLDFHRRKFSNKNLYDWLASQLRSLHYQAHRSALDAARAAEAAFVREIGAPNDVLRGDSYNAQFDGLLAGEWLQHAVDRLERDFFERNTRRDEITLNISLAELNAPALVMLRVAGVCEFDIPVGYLNRFYPGQTERRIRSVSFTVASAVSSFGATPMHVQMHAADDGTAAFDRDHTVLSTGQSDFGVFEPSLSDERYLPFEGASLDNTTWTLRALGVQEEFDYGEIADVVLHVRYDAESTPADEPAATPTVSTGGRTRLLTARADFPNEWAARTETLELPAAPSGFAYRWLALPGGESLSDAPVIDVSGATDVLIVLEPNPPVG